MSRSRYGYNRWPQYVPVAERRRNAAQLATQFAGAGRSLDPVRILAGGNKITETFWGSAWCQNLERFSDFSNRLPRGRTYVRNGSVIDLQLAAGKVTALVSGSSVYEIEITVKPIPKPQWRQLCADCATDIDSLVELLQGRLSTGVMEVLCRPTTGLFPEPAQITMKCSCPDWATMCKHVAAVLYGVGARLDRSPELLFTLRQVDHQELVAASGSGITNTTAAASTDDLADADLEAIFGIDLATPSKAAKPPARTKPAAAQPRATKQKHVEAGPALPQMAKTRGVKPEPARTQPASAQLAAPQLANPQLAKPKRPARRKPASFDPWITAAELRQLGVPNHAVQAWLNKGLLTHSGERGIYVRSDDVANLVQQYLTSQGPVRKPR